jgi:hypothetical protein
VDDRSPHAGGKLHGPTESALPAISPQSRKFSSVSEAESARHVR